MIMIDNKHVAGFAPVHEVDGTAIIELQVISGKWTQAIAESAFL